MRQPLPARWQTFFGQVPGDHQRHCQLDHLRRLETHDPEVEPALRALADLTEYQHRDQHRQPEPYSQGLQRRSVVGFTWAMASMIAERKDDPQGLAFDLVEIFARGRIQDDQAETGQQQQARQQWQIDMEYRQQTLAPVRVGGGQVAQLAWRIVHEPSSGGDSSGSR